MCSFLIKMIKIIEKNNNFLFKKFKKTSAKFFVCAFGINCLIYKLFSLKKFNSVTLSLIFEIDK